MNFISKIIKQIQTFGWACKQMWKASRKGVIAMSFFLFCQGIIPGAALLAIKSIVNLITSATDINQVLGAIIGIVIIWGLIMLAEGLLEPIVLLIRARLNLHILTQCNLILFDKANAYPTLESFGKVEFYDEMQRLQEEAKTRPLNYAYALSYTFKELMSVVSVFAALISISPLLPLFLTLSCIPAALCTLWLGGKSWELSLYRGPLPRRLSWISSLAVNGTSAKEIRLFGLKSYLRNLYLKTVDQFPIGSKKTQIYLCLKAATLFLLTISGYTMTLIWILTNPQFLSGSIGAIAVTVQAFFIAQKSLGQLFQSLGFLAQNLVFFKHLHLFQSKPLPQPLKRAQSKAPFSFNQIEFENISFCYPDGRLALSNLNLTLYRNQTLAIVGSNGSGKSTFINLLTRMYEPTKGRILIDGVDIQSFDIETWRHLFSAVYQSFTLYRFSIGENIHIGDLKRPLEEIQEAAYRGGIDSFVEGLNEQYNTQIGQEFGGTALSGGEQQKLMISRALFRKSPVLIFDEPTAALDPISEQEIFKRIWTEGKERTLILVTHRLGSVSMADRIVVFKGGGVVEDGTHKALLQANKDYAHLYQTQADLYLK